MTLKYSELQAELPHTCELSLLSDSADQQTMSRRAVIDFMKTSKPFDHVGSEAKLGIKITTVFPSLASDTEAK